VYTQLYTREAYIGDKPRLYTREAYIGEPLRKEGSHLRRRGGLCAQRSSHLRREGVSAHRAGLPW